MNSNISLLFTSSTIKLRGKREINLFYEGKTITIYFHFCGAEGSAGGQTQSVSNAFKLFCSWVRLPVQHYFLSTLVALLSWMCLTAQCRDWINLASFSKEECWWLVLSWVSISSVWKVNVYYISLKFDLGITVMEFIKSVFLLLLWENFQLTLRMTQSNGIPLFWAAFHLH